MSKQPSLVRKLGVVALIVVLLVSFGILNQLASAQDASNRVIQLDGLSWSHFALTDANDVEVMREFEGETVLLGSFDATNLKTPAMDANEATLAGTVEESLATVLDSSYGRIHIYFLGYNADELPVYQINLYDIAGVLVDDLTEVIVGPSTVTISRRVKPLRCVGCEPRPFVARP